MRSEGTSTSGPIVLFIVLMLSLKTCVPVKRESSVNVVLNMMVTCDLTN